MLILALMGPAVSGCESTQEVESQDLVSRGDVTLTPNANVVTYYTASWTSELSGRTRLEIDDGDVPVLVTDWQDGPNAVDVPVLGLWPSHTFSARLVDETEGLLARSEFTTAAGPTEMSLTTTNGTATWGGYLVTGIANSLLQTVVVLAPNGQPVWYWQTEGSYFSRACLRRDGLGLWLLRMPPSLDGLVPGSILSVAWDGTVLLDVSPFGHEGQGPSHDLLELEDGRLLFLAPDDRAVDGTVYTGHTLYALETDGSETQLWSAWDDFTPDSTFRSPPDWTHANALRWNEDRKTLWVSLRGLNALVELDPETWRPINEFGGPNPSFEVSAGTVPPSGQHQFDFRGGRLAVHDNRDVEQGSRVVVYDVDFESRPGQIVETWEFVPNPPFFDYIMGDVSWLDDDGLVVTWSAAGMIEERRLDGASPWSIQLDLGALFLYTQRVDALPGTTPVSPG
ncbi:hypothetical protein LBMAG42_22390 [Deltaproteobacteria bacterium]|nr:hypothetical protein LBMAG42_22390 [Deltaproteobacteria bacterium]